MKAADVKACVEHRAVTPLGEVLFRATGLSTLTFETTPLPAFELPPGMAVDGVQLVRVRFGAPVSSGTPLILTVEASAKGYPETGEWLDSMEFSFADGHLQLGMRDCEWLAEEGIDAEWIEYEPCLMRQIVKHAPADALLYISIAWWLGTRDELDHSAWFAVDLALPTASEWRA